MRFDILSPCMSPVFCRFEICRQSGTGIGKRSMRLEMFAELRDEPGWHPLRRLCLGAMVRRVIRLFSALLMTVFCGVALAQPSVVTPRVGLLLAGSDANSAELEAFRKGLSERGIDPDRDVELVVRHSVPGPSPDDDPASELSKTSASVLIGSSLQEVFALQRVAPHTPIVMVAVGDPVGTGLAESMERPGGLVTGLSDFRADYAETRLSILSDLLPGRHRFGFLYNPDAPTAKITREAASRRGIILVPLAARTPSEIDAVLAGADNSSMDAILVVPFPASFQRRRLIGEWASARNLPVMFGYAEFMDLPDDIGGVASYGTDLLDLYRRAAGYAAAILGGANVSELPIQRPEKGDLVVNLRVARRLGITIPEAVMRKADHVMR
jgi:putative tryptophan/tyrosine transport system substrate-binding protein